MTKSLEKYGKRLFELCRIASIVDEWKDDEILNLIYLLIVDRVLHDNFILDLHAKIAIAKSVALDHKSCKEIDNDSEI